MTKSKLEDTTESYSIKPIEPNSSILKEGVTFKYNNFTELETYIDESMQIMGGTEGFPQNISQSVQVQIFQNILMSTHFNLENSKSSIIHKHYYFPVPNANNTYNNIVEIFLCKDKGKDVLGVQFHKFENNAFYRKLFNMLNEF